MDRIYMLPEDDSGEMLYQRIYLLIRKSHWTWRSFGAVLGLAGGMLTILLGLLLWPLTSFLAPGGFGSYLNALGTLCFILPLPLLALGAYCLDLLEKMPSPPRLPVPAKIPPAHLKRRVRLRPHLPSRN